MTPREAVQTLCDAGLTERGIVRALEAKGISCSQPTIHRLKTGEIPDARYSLGIALIQLAKRRKAA